MARFSQKKFDNMVLYVAKKVPQAQLGAVKLNKIIYYADMIAYMQLGKSITGETYLKRQFGPVPKHILGSIERLEARGALRVQESSIFGLQKRDYIPLAEPDISSFSAKELALIDDVANFIAENHTAMSISDVSHTAIWELAEIGEDLPYYTFLVGSLGEIDENDVKWAYQTYKEPSVQHKAA